MSHTIDQFFQHRLISVNLIYFQSAFIQNLSISQQFLTSSRYRSMLPDSSRLYSRQPIGNYQLRNKQFSEVPLPPIFIVKDTHRTTRVLSLTIAVSFVLSSSIVYYDHRTFIVQAGVQYDLAKNRSKNCGDY